MFILFWFASCRASVDVDISVADAWELWNDREKIPRWMKWIDNVTVRFFQFLTKRFAMSNDLDLVDG